MSYDLVNYIPRYLTAITEWLACVLFLFYIPHKRFPGGIAFLLHILALGMLIAVNRLNELAPLILWFPAMLLCMGVMFGFLMLCGRCGIWEGLYCWANAFLLAELGASLGWKLFYYASCAVQLGKAWEAVAAVITLGTAVAVDAAVALLIHHQRKIYATFITPRHALQSLAIALAAFGMSNSNYAFNTSVVSVATGAGVLYVRTLFDLIGMIAMITQDLQLHESQLTHEL